MLHLYILIPSILEKKLSNYNDFIKFWIMGADELLIQCSMMISEFKKKVSLEDYILLMLKTL